MVTHLESPGMFTVIPGPKGVEDPGSTPGFGILLFLLLFGSSYRLPSFPFAVFTVNATNYALYMP